MDSNRKLPESAQNLELQEALAAAAASLEANTTSHNSDQPSASLCIPMSELKKLALEDPDVESTWNDDPNTPGFHVRGCNKCSLRLSAFRKQRPAARPMSQTSDLANVDAKQFAPAARFRLGRTALRIAAALLIAISLSLIAIQQQQSKNSPPHQPTHKLSQLGTNINPIANAFEIEYFPQVFEDENLRIDQFQLVAKEDCSILVILRGWDQSCSCIDWTRPGSVISPIQPASEIADPNVIAKRNQLEQQSAKQHASLPEELFIRRSLRAGDTLELDLDVTRHPPLEQLLLIVRAPRLSQLPQDLQSAIDLIECMEDCRSIESPNHDPLWDANDSAYYLEAATDCLPTGLKVMGRTFWVK